MRILYVVTGATYGGAPAHVLNLIRGDLKRGYKVGLVSGLEPWLIEEAKKLKIYHSLNPYFVQPFHPFKDLLAFLPVYKAIRYFKPDLVSAHSTKAGIVARLACALLKKKVVFTAHGWAFTEGRRMWKRRIFALVERFAALFTKKVICVSNYDKDLALKFKIAPPEKLVVIHNGVDPDPFVKADGSKIREEFNLNDEIVICMVGRLAPPKDHFTLLKALKMLKGKVKLLSVGDGNLGLKIKEYIVQNDLNDSIVLTGKRKDVPQFLAASDIFVLSSQWEGLPYTIIEAMMSGLPVIATRVGGVPELVEDGITGYLVPPKDHRSMASAINKIINDPSLRQHMGKMGRKKAMEKFTLERMLQETEKVYEDITLSTKGRSLLKRIKS